jgi:hypothetical protein
MRRGITLFIVTVCLAGLVCSASFAEKFYLKGGDVVSGELISYENDTFRVKSALGVLSIEASQLIQIRGNSDEGVVTIVIGTPTPENQDRITGTIETAREGEFRIKTEYGYVVVNSLDKLAGITLDTSAEIADPTSKTVPTPKPQVCENNKFLFELYHCTLAGNTVTCAFKAKNNDKDKGLQFLDETRMYDDFGEEYKATQVQVGPKKSNGFSERTYITGVPVDTNVTFKGVSPETTLVKVLVIRWYAGSHGECEFRDIPLSR